MRFNRHHAMIHQNVIVQIQMAVWLAVDRQFVTANPHVRVAAGSIPVDGLAGFIGKPPRWRRAGPVAVRDHDRVRTDGRFHAAQEQVI